MTGGNAYQARVQYVGPGKPGKPGQLMGAVTDPNPLGALFKNTCRGVFGNCGNIWNGQPMELCPREEILPGRAVIRSTVLGSEPREYSVEIVKVYPGTREDGRDLLIRITDPELLAATGGIVQGMSGSPIIQDGKLVGAVTHVLVNDPTSGYGIFIENMLDAAG
jgi:stage IV sporulation protein B